MADFRRSHSFMTCWIALLASILALLIVHGEFNCAMAHGIGGKDASFVAATKGADILPFMYLGAKHMVTGYDHLLFILGVIFFLYRMRDVLIYVTLFSIGHSITLLAGVLLKIDVNAYVVDAIIGLSVAYKAFDNMVGFNIGVEIGQLIALAVFLVIMLQWRRRASFERYAVAANALILTAGFMLIEYQLA